MYDNSRASERAFPLHETNQRRLLCGSTDLFFSLPNKKSVRSHHNFVVNAIDKRFFVDA